MAREDDPVKPFIEEADGLVAELLKGPHGDLMREEQNRRLQVMMEGGDPDAPVDEDDEEHY